VSRVDRLIDRALTVAHTSEHQKWKLGAILMRGSSIIAACPNIVRNPPSITQGPGASWHAEERCLRRTFYQADRAEGCTIIVARVSKNGVQRLARPCISCYTKLVEAGVSRIIYTLDDYGHGIEKITRK